jgi:hypothetical protein
MFVVSLNSRIVCWILVKFRLEGPFFLIRLVEGGVQLGQLGTSATNWPTVLGPGDYENGEFGKMAIGRGNRSTRRKRAPVPLCPPQIPHDTTGHEPRPPRWGASD